MTMRSGIGDVFGLLVFAGCWVFCVLLPLFIVNIVLRAIAPQSEVDACGFLANYPIGISVLVFVLFLTHCTWDMKFEKERTTKLLHGIVGLAITILTSVAANRLGVTGVECNHANGNLYPLAIANIVISYALFTVPFCFCGLCLWYGDVIKEREALQNAPSPAEVAAAAAAREAELLRMKEGDREGRGTYLANLATPNQDVSVSVHISVPGNSFSASTATATPAGGADRNGAPPPVVDGWSAVSSARPASALVMLDCAESESTITVHVRVRVGDVPTDLLYGLNCPLVWTYSDVVELISWRLRGVPAQLRSVLYDDQTGLVIHPSTTVKVGVAGRVSNVHRLRLQFSAK